ncbi:ribonuclease HI [Chitinophaga pendula]|uniref:ribonuclease HI n=1 Tax=Chitinophaga TaxID=79328 RepID=UPI000BAEE0E6|nr:MULTISPECIES: ribonuclease HI [Chitinophaga]ASZ13213.1 ribonuclease HI [Chitinophaga sp. MD30]UCJ09167.1 ribonuclease HI [Chitinophaga pendula]
MADLIIYTDGSSRGNPGPGGYGVILMWGQVRKEISQGYRRTTNNRMELLAVIVALEALKKPGLVANIFTDSEYVVNAVTKGWLWNWVKIGFKDKKNADLWKRFIPLFRQHQVKLNWVKGHASNPFNNRCDELATSAADSGNWLIDEGFEQAEKGL